MASSKKYQWLALAVKNTLEKGERRLLSESLAALAADSEEAESESPALLLEEPGQVLATAHLAAEALFDHGAAEALPRHSGQLLAETFADHGASQVDDVGVLATAHLAAETLAEHAAESDDDGHGVPAAGQRSHSNSRSPRMPRNAAAMAASSVELGAQTLVDVVRARMRQSLRSWVTHARHHRLQDLHSSVLQSLQIATKVKLETPSHHGAGPLAGAHGYPHQQSPEQGEGKIQPSSVVGSKYCTDSLRLRSKERHVRDEEKRHGAGHPEVARALLDLASHHGELGNIDAQREAMQRALTVQQQSAHDGHSIESRLHEVDAAEAAREEQASHLLARSQAAFAACGQESRQISAVLQDPVALQSPHHAREGSTDAIVRSLYDDQARVDEVIKLANKLLESGVLSTGPRKPPILKSSLLIRLAERCHNAAMRDAVQHWWRQGSLKRAVQEMGITGSAPHSAHPTASHGATSHGGVWQDAHHSGLGAHVDEKIECQRLRAELEAMEQKLAEYAARAAHPPLHLDDTSMHSDPQSAALAEENARLREELLAMQAASKRGLVVEQPLHRSGGASSSRKPSSASQHDPSQQHQVEHLAPSTERGKLVVRIIAAHNLRNRDSGTGLHFGHHAFAVARVGGVQHQTQSGHDKLNPVWDSTPFEFQVDLRRVHEKTLCLKVMDHNLFHLGTSLGELEVEIPTLTPGETYKKHEILSSGSGAEIEFEVCYTGPAHEVEHESSEDHPLPTPHGILSVRVLSAHNIHDPHSDLNDETSHPFVVTRLGNRDFRTSAAKIDHDQPRHFLWQQEPFCFQHVNISRPTLQTLHLLVYNHRMFHISQRIGMVEVHVPSLEAGKTLKMRETLEGSDGSELEFEVCFMPEGEQALPEASSKQPSVASQSRQSSRQPSLASQSGHTAVQNSSREQPSTPRKDIEHHAVKETPVMSESAVDDLLASLGAGDTPSEPPTPVHDAHGAQEDERRVYRGKEVTFAELQKELQFLDAAQVKKKWGDLGQGITSGPTSPVAAAVAAAPTHAAAERTSVATTERSSIASAASEALDSDDDDDEGSEAPDDEELLAGMGM